MTDVPLPDSTRCPDCRTPLSVHDRCPSCGLRLTGPEAARLWDVDVQLLGLERSRGVLLAERSELLHVLHTDEPESAQAAPQPPSEPASAEWAAPGGAPAEWTPQRVQNLLLTVGGLLLAAAGTVFAAVTYERLGATGRALVLVALTVAAGAAAARVRARGLSATAEALGALAVVLAALDAYGLRKLGLAAGSDPLSYAAASAAVLSAGAAVYARAVPLRIVAVLAVVLAQLPVPLLLVRDEVSYAVLGVALATQAAVDLALLTAGRRLPQEVRTALGWSSAVFLGLAVLGSLVSAYADRDPAGAAALVLCAIVLAAAAAAASGRRSTGLAAGVAPLLGAAAHSLVVDDTVTGALVLGAVGLLTALACGQLPSDRRTGPVVGALSVSAAAVLAVAEPALVGALSPLTWLGDPWTLPAGRDARGALGPGQVWTGEAHVAVVLLAAAGAALAADRALHRTGRATAAAGALAGCATVLLPLALDLPYAAGLGLLLLVGAGTAAGGVALLGRAEAVPLVGAGTALCLYATAWSAAAQTSTLVVLGLTALVCAGLAATRLPGALPAVAVGGAGVLAGAELAAAGAAAELAADQTGALLLVPVAVLAAVAPRLDVRRRVGAEVAAPATGLTALALTAGDPGWLSWTLLGLGLIALATALRADRRPAALLAAVLMTGSSWVRLAEAGVDVPEPYLLPVAVAALGIAHLRRRTDPDATSWVYAPGLSLALLPTLLVSLDRDDLTRSLLVGLAALAVLLAGAWARLQAPLALGAAVLAVDAVRLLGPYAAALPRWLSLGAAGALLIAVGANYEQRRRDVGRLRQRYDALA